MEEDLPLQGVFRAPRKTANKRIPRAARKQRKKPTTVTARGRPHSQADLFPLSADRALSGSARAASTAFLSSSGSGRTGVWNLA